MMLNAKLEAFVCVATAGSFSKAAKATFMTPTALNKQISLLEKELGVKLFERTHSGLTLTKAGQSLYTDTKKIIQYCNESVIRAKNAAYEDNGIIRIGSSFMTPVRMIYRLYAQICETNPDIKLQIIHFDNSKETADEILPTLGEAIDVVCSNFDEKILSSYGCCATELARLPFQCAMSFHHRLSKNEKLSICDLYGEQLLILKEGLSTAVDQIRYDLQRHHPQIDLCDFDVFDTSVFNLCESEGYITLAIPCWENMYPMLKIVPVDWNYTISFGILHAPHPTRLVRRFIEAAKAASKEL